jgi:phenylpropionate dioxygenase-like ring-hydroxylating dioxygenase large terminal subunit
VEPVNSVAPPSYKTVSDESLAWLGTGPIPALPYYDPAWFELEREAVFRRSWLQVGHVCELTEPGSFIRREIEMLRASILVTRSKDGGLNAFHNVCTHRGTQLVEETEGRRATFSCPYHRWTYGIDGRFLSAPDFERFAIDKAECNLPKVAVDVCGGFIFVNFDPASAQGLRDFLGPLANQLEMLPSAQATILSEYVYDIDAGWKVTCDNFQENYHLRVIHPRSLQGTIAPENPFGYPTQYDFHGPHRTQTIWDNPAATAQPIQGLSFAKAMGHAIADGTFDSPTRRAYISLFPNFFILGIPEQPFSHAIWPVGPGKSRGVIRMYWTGEDDSASRRYTREYIMAQLRDVHAEDRAVIEAGQRGLASGALKHIHFQSQEALCRHLFLAVSERVEAYRAELAGGATGLSQAAE